MFHVYNKFGNIVFLHHGGRVSTTTFAHGCCARLPWCIMYNHLGLSSASTRNSSNGLRSHRLTNKHYYTQDNGCKGPTLDAIHILYVEKLNMYVHNSCDGPVLCAIHVSSIATVDNVLSGVWTLPNIPTVPYRIRVCTPLYMHLDRRTQRKSTTHEQNKMKPIIPS